MTSKIKSKMKTQQNRIKRNACPHTSKDIEQLVCKANETMFITVSKIDELKIPLFGSSLYSAGDHSCVFHNADSIIASTVADRIVSKFERPCRDTQRQLWRECSEDWQQFERGHIEKYAFGNLDSAARATVYRSRAIVKKWLFDVPARHKNVWQHLEDAPIAFGPGESFNSCKGDVSTFSKLRNTRNWTVTLELSEPASKFIAVNRGLRECLKPFFAQKRVQRRLLSRKIGRRVKVIHQDSLHRPLNKGVDCYAVRVLNEFFYEYPLDHKNCRVKRGSAGTSVYKNRKKRRFINKECLINSVMQKMLGWSIRQCLKQIGIDLDLGQAQHRALIANSNYSTIDESNASESIVHSTLQEIIGNKRFNKIIDSTRSDSMLLETFFSEESSVKQWFPVKKTSAMGNGYTFELLTLVLASVSRQFDKTSKVYGDDIVCTNESVQNIVNAITSIGFIVNEKKSFIKTPLRESCGGFYLENRGYITCFDIKWMRDIADVILVANKLRRIIEWNLNWNHKLKGLLIETYDQLKTLIPRNYVGPVSSFKDVPVWLELENYARVCRKSDIANALYRKHSKLLEDLASLYQLDPRSLQVVQLRDKVNPVRVNIQDNVRSNALLYSYVLIGKRSIMYYRRPDDIVYRNVNVIISPCGNAIRVGTARRIVSKWYDHLSLILACFLQANRIGKVSI